MRDEMNAEVPAELAYVAARDRALRTTEALILAESRIIALDDKLRAATRRADEADEVAKHTKQLLNRRTRTLQRRIDALKGVDGDGAEDQDNGCDAGGEADTAHDFSD